MRKRESLYIHKELSGFKSVSLANLCLSSHFRVFEKSLQYVKRFSRYKNPDAVRQVREILSRYQLAEFELCVLGNLCPETVEEAIAMVPSIKVNLFGLNMWLSSCVYLIFAGLKIC